MGITGTRRTTIAMLAAGVAALGLAGAASAQDRVLNITTYDKYIPQRFLDKFQQDTGIEVRIRLTDDQGKQYNLLTAEAAQPTTDIVTVTGHRLQQFINGNLLEPLDTSRLSGWGNLAPTYAGAPQLTSGDQVWGVPILAGFEALARNTDLTEPSDTWGVMFDPQYEGMTSYILSDFFSIVMLWQGNDGDFVTYTDRAEAEADAAEAEQFLIEQKPMVRKYYDAGAEVQQMFVNEDIVLAQSWSGPIAKLIMDGLPIEMSIPKEGTYGFVYSFNIARGAPNADAAYQFLDALLSDPEVGAEMTRETGYASTFAGVPDQLSEQERKALILPDEQMGRIQFFSDVNRDMKNEIIDAAVARIKAAN